MDKNVERKCRNVEFLEDVVLGMNNTAVNTELALIQSIPGIGDGASAVYELAKKEVEKRLESKRKNLVKCLLKNDVRITSEELKNINYYTDFVNLINLCEKVKSYDKVDAIVKLFSSTHTNSDNSCFDEYDEYLEKLKVLSMREIDILRMLYEIGECKEEFFEKVFHKFNISKDITVSILTAVSKTGFCREKTGAYLGYSGGEFYTTEYFERFLELTGVCVDTPDM